MMYEKGLKNYIARKNKIISFLQIVYYPNDD